MTRHGITAALLASALFVAGCGESEDKAATANEAIAADNASNAAAPAEAESEAPGQNTNAPDGVMTAGSTQQSLSIVNNSGRTVTRLANSVAGEDDWGIDMLAMQPLPNGETARADFGRGSDQCLWDFRATFEGGETRDWRGVNLCEVTTLTLTPS